MSYIKRWISYISESYRSLSLLYCIFVSYIWYFNVRYNTLNLPYDITNWPSFYLYIQYILGYWIFLMSYRGFRYPIWYSKFPIWHYKYPMYHNYKGHYHCFIEHFYIYLYIYIYIRIRYFVSYIECFNVLYNTLNLQYDINNVPSFYLYIQYMLGYSIFIMTYRRFEYHIWHSKYLIWHYTYLIYHNYICHYHCFIGYFYLYISDIS